MLDTKLTPCGNLLYQWLLPRAETGGKITVDLQDFRAWTAEYREKPYSDREILDALRQLKEQQFISVSKTEITLEVKQVLYSNFNSPPPVELLLITSDRPNPICTLLRIVSISILLGLASIAIGFFLVKAQPKILKTPNPLSIPLENNISTNP